MDTLSASVSSFNLPSLPPLRRRSTSFKPTINATASATASTNLPKPPTSSSPSSYSKSKNSTFPRGISLPLQQAKPSRAPPSLSPPVHEKAASGFAAALVSVCQSKNCLGRTQEDVRRLMEFLVGQEKKRNNNNKVLVDDVVERGKFGKHLKGLVKMLVTRGKSGILFDVLMEFERICNELVVVGTTKLVWVT